MLIVQAEIRRRLDALEDAPGHVATRLGEQTGNRFCLELAPEGDDAIGLA